MIVNLAGDYIDLDKIERVGPTKNDVFIVYFISGNTLNVSDRNDIAKEKFVQTWAEYRTSIPNISSIRK